MTEKLTVEDVEKKVNDTFAGVASSIGFSPIHGKIIGALLVGGRSMPLQKLAKKTGYSSSMISLSLDLLELLNVIKKVKKSADRKLYVELNSNLLETLKNVLVLRIKRNVSDSMEEFENSRKRLEGIQSENKDKVINGIEILENEIKRLHSYIELLDKIKLPG
ncbi:MAG: hypothetical protein JW754_03020 [Candidatus Aenigmarchaeota archaeon]|nr:hypothetical protein [Candidatus Aenigmarchaeota archaeon]